MRPPSPPSAPWCMASIAGRRDRSRDPYAAPRSRPGAGSTLAPLLHIPDLTPLGRLDARIRRAAPGANCGSRCVRAAEPVSALLLPDPCPAGAVPDRVRISPARPVAPGALWIGVDLPVGSAAVSRAISRTARSISWPSPAALMNSSLSRRCGALADHRPAAGASSRAAGLTLSLRRRTYPCGCEPRGRNAGLELPPIGAVGTPPGQPAPRCWMLPLYIPTPHLPGARTVIAAAGASRAAPLPIAGRPGPRHPRPLPIAARRRPFRVALHCDTSLRPQGRER